jgi:high-affinity Fe2+/Pb2+ permease
MFAVALIVFRETLEAALIVSIVLAASIGIPGRGRWIGAGVAGGILGATMVALFAAAIEQTFAGSGQELLNAAILGLAVCMLAWHNIWMASHARELIQEANNLRRLFAVVSVLVLFLAAGLATQCVSFLSQDDLLPTLGEGLWDTSFLLDEDGIAGRILHTLIGYTARPSGIQLLAWIVTIWLIHRRRNASALTVLAAIVIGITGLSGPAAADTRGGSGCGSAIPLSLSSGSTRGSLAAQSAVWTSGVPCRVKNSGREGGVKFVASAVLRSIGSEMID